MKIAGKTAVMIIIGVAGQQHDDGRRGGGHSVISAEASVETLSDLVKLDAILAETVAQCSDGPPRIARCSIFWMPAGQEIPARARANGGQRSARTMSGIPTAMGISQYMK